MRKLVIVGSLFLSAVAFGHSRFVNPPPRDAGIIGNDGNKTPAGPCGNLKPKPATTALSYTPGQSVTLKFEETIDHPGRYYINFSPANDLNFDANRLIEVADVQGGTLPHEYTTTVTLPMTPCENCTLQLIQSMEENPAAPSFYHSCIDMNIRVATTTPAPTPTPVSPAPSPGGVTSQSTGSAGDTAPTAKMGGCGGSSAHAMLSPQATPFEQHAGLASLMVLLLPIATFVGLRRRHRKN